MIRIATLLLCLFLSSALSAQQGGISPADGARLEKIWHQFATAISARDSLSLYRLSLQDISCLGCTSDTSTTGYYEPSPVFFRKILAIWPQSQFWGHVTASRYWVNTIVTSERPANLPADKKHYVIYELAFADISKQGSRSASWVFQFADVKGTLWFFGIAAVH
jgi:hypothetical protein